jgi:hypothetical protein
LGGSRGEGFSAAVVKGGVARELTAERFGKVVAAHATAGSGGGCDELSSSQKRAERAVPLLHKLELYREKQTAQGRARQLVTRRVEIQADAEVARGTEKCKSARSRLPGGEEMVASAALHASNKCSERNDAVQHGRTTNPAIGFCGVLLPRLRMQAGRLEVWRNAAATVEYSVGGTLRKRYWPQSARTVVQRQRAGVIIIAIRNT